MEDPFANESPEMGVLASFGTTSKMRRRIFLMLGFYIGGAGVVLGGVVFGVVVGVLADLGVVVAAAVEEAGGQDSYSMRREGDFELIMWTI